MAAGARSKGTCSPTRRERWRKRVWPEEETDLEMAEERPPYADVNPTIRALFLITSNDPPTLAKREQWLGKAKDIITEYQKRSGPGGMGGTPAK